MKLQTKIKILLLVLLNLKAFFSAAQPSRYKPFKIVIVMPDTAVVDSKLTPYIATLESDHLKRYYASIKRFEDILSVNEPSEKQSEILKKSKATIKEELIAAKNAEAETKNFKYYQTISEYSCQILNMYFNEYSPSSTIQIVRSQQTDVRHLERLADSLKADYVVGYHDIHTQVLNNETILKLTTILYSNASHKILFEKETQGDTLGSSDIWSCTNPLSCLLVTGVKSSTDLIFSAVAKRRRKY